MNEIYTTQTCPWCQRAKVLLDRHGIEFTEIDVSTDVEKQAEMIERSQRQSVPQIFLNGNHIGGYDDLVKHFESQSDAAA